MISRLSRRPRLAAFVVLLAAVFFAAPRAEAHAIILSSSPAANSQVPEGPIDVLLQYNSRIDLNHSRVSLVDPAGKVTALKADAGATPGSLTAQGKVDAPGRWIIRWQALSLDGHITRGEIPFQVVAPTP